MTTVIKILVQLLLINILIQKVGFGDIISTTVRRLLIILTIKINLYKKVYEAAFVTFTMLVACIMFSYFLGSISNILVEI